MSAVDALAVNPQPLWEAAGAAHLPGLAAHRVVEFAACLATFACFKLMCWLCALFLCPPGIVCCSQPSSSQWWSGPGILVSPLGDLIAFLCTSVMLLCCC